MKDTINDTYLPEQDDGAKLNGAGCISANMWLPIQSLKNPEALLRSAQFSYVNNRTGKESVVKIASQVGDYLVVAREFLNEEDVVRIDAAFHLPDFKFERYICARLIFTNYGMIGCLTEIWRATSLFHEHLGHK